MLGNSKLSLLILGLVCLPLFEPRPSSAQSIWFTRGRDNTISLEFLKSSFAEDIGATFGTSTWFLSGRFAVTDKFSAVGEIPFSHFGFDEDFSDIEGENAIGNPYCGIEIHSEDSPISGEMGFRLPLVPKDDDEYAVGWGLLTVFVDRSEAFVVDALPISGAANYNYRTPTGFVLRLRGGAAVWIATGDRDESEFFLLYSAQTGYECQQVNFVAGFSGRLLLSEEDLDLGERTFHQLGLAADVDLGAVQPGISLKIPLDEDMRDFLDFVFGFTLSINLK